MSTSPYISPEADRRAYQVGKNITRLDDHKKRLAHLENRKAQLSVHMINKYGTTADSVAQLEQCIETGWRALDNGESIQDAVAAAENQLTTLQSESEK